MGYRMKPSNNETVCRNKCLLFLKIPKRSLEPANRRTDNTMFKEKGQTTI